MSDAKKDAWEQDRIADHHDHPRRFGDIDPTQYAIFEGRNPVCGDVISLKLASMDHGHLSAANFDHRGCVLSKASASMMMEWLSTQPSMANLPPKVHEVLMVLQGKASLPENDTSSIHGISDLKALKNVHRFPLRISCITLPWILLQDALAQLTQDKVRPIEVGGS